MFGDCGGPIISHGKVLCSGEPAAGAVLVFHRESGQDAPRANAASTIPSAIAGDDGSFTVESQPLGYGAAPGKYKVLIQWPEASDPAHPRSSTKTKTASVGGKKVDVTRRNKLDPSAARSPQRPLHGLEQAQVSCRS